MEVARVLRSNYPLSFPGPGNEMKDARNISRICYNGLRRAVKKYKEKTAILNQTGNSGPPETEFEKLIR